MFTNKFILASLLVLFAVQLGFSQTQKLSLAEALELAKQNNYDLKSAAAKIEAAKAQYKMTNSVFLPEVTLSYTGISTNDPLSSFGFKLKQEVVNQADFNPERLNDPGTMENFQTKLELRQPLLNLDGIYARKAAKNMFEAAQLQNTRTQHSIEYEVKKAYFMLELAASAVNVLQKSVTVAEEALRLTENNARQGFAKKADVLEASVRLEERRNQLLEAQNQQQGANELLAHLLGLPLNQLLSTTDSLLQNPAQIVANIKQNQLENRSDLKAFQKQIEAGEHMLKSSKMKFVPRVNAFGSVEWNDKKLAGTSGQNYMLGASLSWNLFNGFKNAGAVQHAQAQLSDARINYKNYLSQSELQANMAFRKASLNYQRIQSGKLAKEQAQESLRIRTNRFKEGLEKTADLLMAEALSAQKELEYIQSVFNYKQSIFEIELLWEKNINE